MSDVTQHAPNCAGCAEISVTPTDPVSILRRLPRALFNPVRPIPPNVATFDVVLDATQFGPIGGTEPTPQYELARLFAQEKDFYLREQKRAVALQHGLGLMSVNADGETTCQCPSAAGADLDHVGEQFGVGRPLGFTDCCYWRLVQLLLFKPGTTLWLLREIAELYTGVRPAIIESVAQLSLAWPVNGGVTFSDRRDAGDPNSGWYADVDAYADGDVEVVPPDAFHAFALADPPNDLPPAPLHANSFALADAGMARANGLRLEEAIGLVKAAGTFVDYLNLPPVGAAGCYGATLRGPAVGAFAS